MDEFNPNNKLQALVPVMIPKNGTLQWECLPNARFVILLEAACEDSSSDTRHESDRGTDEFIECWRTVTEVREYVQRFNMLSVPSDYFLNEILHVGRPAKVDGKIVVDRKIVDELMKYPREPDKFLYSIARGINSRRIES